jgi:hypothetical protein
MLDERADRAVGAIDAMGFEGPLSTLKPHLRHIRPALFCGVIRHPKPQTPNGEEKDHGEDRLEPRSGVHFFLQVVSAWPFLVAYASLSLEQAR